jgi:hypothetical protein
VCRQHQLIVEQVAATVVKKTAVVEQKTAVVEQKTDLLERKQQSTFENVEDLQSQVAQQGADVVGTRRALQSTNAVIHHTKMAVRGTKVDVSHVVSKVVEVLDDEQVRTLAETVTINDQVHSTIAMNVEMSTKAEADKRDLRHTKKSSAKTRKSDQPHRSTDSNSLAATAAAASKASKSKSKKKPTAARATTSQPAPRRAAPAAVSSDDSSDVSSDVVPPLRAAYSDADMSWNSEEEEEAPALGIPYYRTQVAQSRSAQAHEVLHGSD